MNTYPEHIGNELGKLTDKDLHRVLLQYAEKNFDSVQDMLKHLKLVAECKDFDYLGQIDTEKLDEKDLKAKKIEQAFYKYNPQEVFYRYYKETNYLHIIIYKQIPHGKDAFYKYLDDKRGLLKFLERNGIKSNISNDNKKIDIEYYRTYPDSAKDYNILFTQAKGLIDSDKFFEILGDGKEFSMEETIVKPVEFTGKKFSNYYQTYNGHDVYHTCVVLTEPNISWKDCQVKDLETQKEFLCSKKYILDHELKDKNIRTIFVENKTQEEITNWIKSNTKLGTIYAAFEGGVDAEILIINEKLADLYLPNGERKINIPLEDVAKELKEVTLNKQQDEMER